MKLSVLTYNTHKGFTQQNRQFVLRDIRKALESTDADLVALQEVIGDHEDHAQHLTDWPTEAHFEYLSDNLWPHYSYGKNAIYDKGHHGNAILSKYPFHHIDNHDISQWWFSQRGILHGQILDHLHVACIHVGFLPFEQQRQLRKIEHWLEREVPREAPVLLMGDFNDWHGRIHRYMCRRLGFQEASSCTRNKPAKTFPSHRPRLPLDRIYYRNLTLDSAKVLQGHPWNRLSDHCPIQATFLLEEH